MGFGQQIGLAILALCLAACARSSPAEQLGEIEIAPGDFVLLPCSTDRPDRPCALAVAGGKRILFGAPAGSAAGLQPADLRQLDAVIVFGLHADELEGLDEVRNESWRAGRDAPLLVIGPEGIDTVSTALNTAFEQADALRIVEEGIPPGGYDAAILTPRAFRSGQQVFNTGDVVIEARGSGFRMTYNGETVLDLENCRSGGQEPDPSDPAHVRVSCAMDEAGPSWPLRAPLTVYKTPGPE